ncbi:MAG: ABC transporter ATP-binding protein [Burkholderiales bacterium]|nr:ABC transporter ATP-binding protein [Burkholderiales bacterium]
MSTARALLSVLGVGRRAGTALLLESVSFAVDEGAVLAVLGANGAGKSTLMAALAGDSTLDRGDIEFSGKPLAAWSPLELASRRALNASEPPVPFAMSVADYVALGRPFAAPDAEAVTAALAECHADPWRARDYATLSMGEQLRVQLARSLYQLGANQGRTRCLWLLDEPCAHLDMVQRQFVLKLMQRFAKALQWAVVFSTHDPLEAQAIADHALLMRHGRALLHAPTEHALDETTLSACYGQPIVAAPAFIAK